MTHALDPAYIPVIIIALLVAWLLYRLTRRKPEPIACSLCGKPVVPGSPGQYDAQVCGECWSTRRGRG